MSKTPPIVETIAVQESGENTQDGTLADEYNSGEDIEGDSCTICLQAFDDRTVIPECSHEFCFDCILRWIDQSNGRRCPLCTRTIESYLIHNIRSNFDYQRYHLPPLRSSPPPIEPLRASRRTRAARNRNPERQWGTRRVRREQDEVDALERAIDKRRWVYQNHLYAKHVASNSITRYRPCPSPAQFSASSDLQSRATVFIRRELRVWVSLDVEFLTTYVISLLKAIDIRSDSATKLLSEFLDTEPLFTDTGTRYPNAEHFAHELYSYLRSPYKSLSAYDVNVQYDEPGQAPRGPKRPRSRDDHPENVSKPNRKYPGTSRGTSPSRPEQVHRNSYRMRGSPRQGSDKVTSSNRSTRATSFDDLVLIEQEECNSTNHEDNSHSPDFSQARSKGKERAVSPTSTSSKLISNNVTVTSRAESVQALGPMPAATRSHFPRTISTSAQQPGNIDDRNAIGSKQSRCFASSSGDERGVNLPISGNAEETDEKMKIISEEFAAANSKDPSRDDKATKLVRSRNPLLLAQAHLRQATNDGKIRGGLQNETRPNNSRVTSADRPSLLSRISAPFDAGIINDNGDSNAYETSLTSASPVSERRINGISPSTSLQDNENFGNLDGKAQEPSLISATTGRTPSDRNRTLEENLRADLLRRLKTEKDLQTAMRTSHAATAQVPPSPGPADTGSIEGDAGDLGTLETKLRSRARLQFKLASEKRISENVNRIDQSNSREPEEDTGGGEFVGKGFKQERSTELRNILKQRRTTSEIA